MFGEVSPGEAALARAEVAEDILDGAVEDASSDFVLSRLNIRRALPVSRVPVNPPVLRPKLGPLGKSLPSRPAHPRAAAESPNVSYSHRRFKYDLPFDARCELIVCLASAGQGVESVYNAAHSNTLWGPEPCVDVVVRCLRRVDDVEPVSLLATMAEVRRPTLDSSSGRVGWTNPCTPGMMSEHIEYVIIGQGATCCRRAFCSSVRARPV
jgi:hypothetical protein